MTVPLNPNTRTTAVGNGVTVVFPFDFLCLEARDLQVSVGDVVLAPSQYSVSGLGQLQGGAVTFVAAPASGVPILMELAVVAARAIDYQDNGDLFAQTVNLDFDRLWLAIKSAFGWLRRALALGPYDVDGQGSYRANNNRIQDLADPVAEQDAVNRRSMFSFVSEYVDKAIAGVVGGYGAFMQAGIGAITRTFQDKMRERVSVTDFTTVQKAVNSAVERGVNLEWPGPDPLVVTESVAGLHSVKAHVGVGKLQRGAHVFTFNPTNGDTNTIYVSPSGDDSNDGITPELPLKTVQAAFNVLLAYGPTLKGNWVVRLAAGTYNGAAQLVGLRSRANIVIRGPDVGGHPNVPTAVIDGTGLSNQVGWYFQFFVRAALYNIKFQNWTAAGDSYGFNGDGHCQIYLENVHADNCRYAGVSFDNQTQVRMLGGIISNCLFMGVRLYSQVSASIGYTGSAIGDSTIIRNCGIGIAGRISCRVHVDYCDVHHNDTGIRAEYSTRVVVNYTKTQNNNVGWYAATGSNIQTSVDGSNPGGNGKEYVCFSSNLSASTANESTYSEYWDEESKRTLWGATAYQTPAAKFEWRLDAERSGSSYNSGVKAVFDGNGTTNYVALSGPATSTVGIAATTVAKPSQGIFAYSFASDFWGLWMGASERYRFYQNRIIPMVDNASALGDTGFRFTTAYLGSNPIVTSDANLKEVRGELSEAEVRAWAKVRAKVFQFKDMIAQKGHAEARLHGGYIAQEVYQAFASEGLDAARYALWCEDEVFETVLSKEIHQEPVMRKRMTTEERVELVDGIAILKRVSVEIEEPVTTLVAVIDEEGNPVIRDGSPMMHACPVMEDVKVDVETRVLAGTRLGLRYEQCLVFEAAYLRWLLAQVQTRLLALEARP